MTHSKRSRIGLLPRWQRLSAHLVFTVCAVSGLGFLLKRQVGLDLGEVQQLAQAAEEAPLSRVLPTASLTTAEAGQEVVEQYLDTEAGIVRTAISVEPNPVMPNMMYAPRMIIGTIIITSMLGIAGLG